MSLARMIAGQDDEALGVRPLLDLKDPLDRLLIRGVAAYAPDSVSGIEEDASCPEHLYGFFDLFFSLFHNSYVYMCTFTITG